MKQLKVAAKAYHTHFHLIADMDCTRIWCSANAGDQFDVFTHEELPPSTIDRLCKLMPTYFIEGFPDDDTGETICTYCKAAQ